MNIGHAFVIGTTLSLFGHVASAQDVSRYRGYVLESSVEAVVGRRLDPSPLYTHRYPLEEVAQALTTMQQRPDGFLKALIEV